MEQLSFDVDATPMSTQSMLSIVKERNEDYEWYPTTQEQIDAIKADIEAHTYSQQPLSVLDCGAGDGRLLKALTEGDRYAIEISETLRRRYGADIMVLGTDFHAQSLIDKHCHLVVSNPPYKEFVTWASKILYEAFSRAVVLILPVRWKTKKEIIGAIESRGWKHKILGTFDYQYADRPANTTVDVIRFFAPGVKWYDDNKGTVDAFDSWFDRTFPEIAEKCQSSATGFYKTSFESALNSRLDAKLAGLATGTDVVVRKDEVSTLIESYNEELSAISDVLVAIGKLSVPVLRELEGSAYDLKQRLRYKVASLKAVYWRRLFTTLPELTARLTCKTRQRFLDKVMNQSSLDFNSENVRAIVMWVLDSASQFTDSQFLETMDKLDEAVDVTLYKSNQKLFERGSRTWRWQKIEGAKYFYDYRCVLESNYSYSLQARDNQTFSTGELIVDLLAISYNLGFDTSNNIDPMEHVFPAGKAVEFYFNNLTTNKREVAFSVKVFNKGTMHITFCKDLMLYINVAMARLRGWVHSPSDVAEELDVNHKKAQAAFSAQRQQDNLLTIL